MTESALTGIRVWDGVVDCGASTLRWEDGRITTIEDAEKAHPGLAVIPGLIDSHVHLDTNVLDGTGADTSWALVTPPEEKALHVMAHALRFAAYGVTTLRDLAATPVQMAVGRALEEGVVPGPRLLASGPVGMTAGHGDLFTPPRHRDRPPVADSPDECRRLVRIWAREGASGIKVYTSGGIMSMGDKVGWRNHTRAELEATVDEAHALGLLVSAHTHTAEGLDTALDLEVDSIEHGTGMTPAHIDRLVARNIPVAPTLLTNTAIATGTAGVRPEAVEKARAILAHRDPAFAAAAAAGVRFILGTDANGRLVRYGGQLEELRLMRRLFGWTAERTLMAATSDAADALGLSGTTGRLTTGLSADFIVIKGTPWLDAEELRTENVVAVVARGRLQSGVLPA